MYKKFSADYAKKQGQEDFAVTSICTTVSGSKNSWKSSLPLKEQGKCIHFSFNVTVQEKRCATVFQPQILSEWVLEPFRNRTETKLAPSLEKQEDTNLTSILGLHYPLLPLGPHLTHFLLIQSKTCSC